MASLPCDVCLRETIVIPSGEVFEDADERLVYRRYRACPNPKCERFRVRRTTWEMYIPSPEVLIDTKQFQEYVREQARADAQPPLFGSSSPPST